MSLYKKYLKESTFENTVRIKVAMELTPEQMDRIERFMQKYDLKEITAPRRTPLQHRPLDFTDITNAEVYIFDATVGYPVQTHALKQEIRELLDIPEQYVIVRNENDPMDWEHFKYDDNMNKEGALLSDDPNYDPNETHIKEEEPSYGDKFVQGKMSIMSQIRAERVMNKKYDSGYELTDYNEPNTETSETKAPTGSYNDRTARWGNFDQEAFLPTEKKLRKK